MKSPGRDKPDGGSKGVPKPVVRMVEDPLASKVTNPGRATDGSAGVLHGIEGSQGAGSSVTHTPLPDAARPVEQGPIPDSLSPAAQALARHFIGSGAGMSQTWGDLPKGLQEGIRSFTSSVERDYVYQGTPHTPDTNKIRWQAVSQTLDDLIEQVKRGEQKLELLKRLAEANPAIVSDMLVVRAMHLVLTDTQVQSILTGTHPYDFKTEVFIKQHQAAYNELREIVDFLNKATGGTNMSLLKEALNGMPYSQQLRPLYIAIGLDQ